MRKVLLVFIGDTFGCPNNGSFPQYVVKAGLPTEHFIIRSIPTSITGVVTDHEAKKVFELISEHDPITALIIQGPPKPERTANYLSGKIDSEMLGLQVVIQGPATYETESPLRGAMMLSKLVESILEDHRRLGIFITADGTNLEQVSADNTKTARLNFIYS